MTGVTTVCKRTSYYTLWRQHIWQYADLPHMQNIIVVS